MVYIKILGHHSNSYMDTPFRQFYLNFLLAGIKHQKYCTSMLNLFT